jgi:hypothetical protein
VKGTSEFLFVGGESYVGSMAGRLKQACGRHQVECFTRSYKRYGKKSITTVRDIHEAGRGGCCHMQIVSRNDLWCGDSCMSV